MTSRVLDGHRKQEVLASSNWNSMLTKSERVGGAPLSSHSHASFASKGVVAQAGTNYQLGLPTTKSANFTQIKN